MERYREREGKKEKADMYCGRVMTGMEEEKPGRQKEGGMWRCSDRPQEGKSVRECCKREETLSSKKPVASGTECADPVAPPLRVNNHHKPWLCLMNPLPMS